MEETGNCPHCKKRKTKDEQKEEVNLALLLALVPILVTTLFSQIGVL